MSHRQNSDDPAIIAEIPRITFGMIVLNGQPFLRYNLRALYPYAHQIIVVEGAAPGAIAIASDTGHSTDGTLKELRRFKAEDDPDDKLVIVTAEDEGYANGFWPGEKDEQSQAYSTRASGDYLWQVDVDEFYRQDDMVQILQMLQEDPSITAVSFKMLQFWGGFDYIVDGYFLRRGMEIFHRLFQWGPGYQYTTHRPPTVIDKLGRDLRERNWCNGHLMADRRIYLYHYSLVFPKQVREKCAYYQAADWARREKAEKWAEETFMQLKYPFRVHNVYNYLSWLERAEVDHPKQVKALVAAIESGQEQIELRNTSDIDHLLNSNRYRLGRAIIKAGEPIDRFLWNTLYHRLARLGSRLLGKDRWLKIRSRILGLTY